MRSKGTNQLGNSLFSNIRSGRFRLNPCPWATVVAKLAFWDVEDHKTRSPFQCGITETKEAVVQCL